MEEDLNNTNNNDIETDGEIEFDEDSENESIDKRIKKLTEKISACNQSKQSYLESWQRAEADFRNLRRRDAEELLESVKSSNRNLLIDILPSLDSLDLAIKRSSEAEFASISEWQQGLQGIKSQIMGSLEKYGLKIMVAKDLKFDTNFHEAIKSVKGTQENDNMVSDVLQEGYMMNDKVLRTAKVSVTVAD